MENVITSPKSLDLVDQIIALETGELDAESALELFASLVNSGLAWQLQGSYGRTAHSLISQGLITCESGTWTAHPENLP